MKITKILASITILFFMLSGCSTLPKHPENIAKGDYSYTKEYMTKWIKNAMKKQDITGLSIALVDDQRVVWAEGFGFADVANNVPATPETIYRAGSISKLFTATAAMQLAEQGKLDIDKPLQTYLPEFCIKSRFQNAGLITPRNLMTHHSGLPSDLLKGMWTKHPEPFENDVKRLKDEYIANPPNYVFSYSNVGVTLLGHAVEKVAGRDFASYLETSVLRPLGMTNSAFSQASDSTPLGAKAYNKGEEARELPLRDLPAGGLNTTVLDLSRFMEMVFAGGRIGDRQIIKPETLAEMLRPQNVDVPLDFDLRIGLAWFLNDTYVWNAGLVATHGGGTLNHHSLLVTLPEHKLGVVVMSNSATAGGVVNKAAAEALKLALEAKTGIRQPEQVENPTGEGSKSQEELHSYEGRYATNFGLVDITRKSDYLRGEIMGTSIRLVPRSDGLFGLQHKLLGIFPISLGRWSQAGISLTTVAGREVVKYSMKGKEELVGERIHLIPISEAWQKRVGEYEIVNSGDDADLFQNVRLRLDNGLILVEYVMSIFTDQKISMGIMPLSDSEAVICGLGRGMGETIQVVNIDGYEMIKHLGYLFKKKQQIDAKRKI